MGYLYQGDFLVFRNIHSTFHNPAKQLVNAPLTLSNQGYFLVQKN